MEDQQKKNGKYRRGKVTWLFHFRWAPGGDPELYAPKHGSTDEDWDRYSENSNGEDDPIPWWMTPDQAALAKASLKPLSPAEEDALFPPDMLNMYILAKHLARDRHLKEVTPSGVLCRSWQCVQCGKVNRMKWMGRYPCSYCHPLVRLCVLDF